MVNTTGQYSFLVKALPSAVADSSSIFWVKLGSGSGLQMVAQARDTSSSVNMWQLYYDWGRGGFVFYPFTNTGSTEIFTGVGTGTPALVDEGRGAVQRQRRPAARACYLNGLTQPTWGVTGNYTRTANLAVLQLWNDAVGTTDFDDARVSTRPPQGATLPGAPTGVTGSPRDRGAALSWTAPASNGGSAISGYRITPYIGVPGADADDHRLSGHELHGHGPDERDDVHVPRRGDQRRRDRRRLGGFGCDHAGCGNVPGAPTGITAVPGDVHGDRRLDAAGQRRRRSAHGYRITPYIGSNAQTPVMVSGGTTTSYDVTGSDERDDVHLPRRGDQCRRNRAGLGCIGGGDAEAGARAVHEPRLRRRLRDRQLLELGGRDAGHRHRLGSDGRCALRHVRRADRDTRDAVRVLLKALASPLQDSLTTFWIRTGSGSRVATVAQARDGASSLNMWTLDYDGARHGFIFYPYRQNGSTEIFTGNNTAASGVWIKVQIEYKADRPAAARRCT